MSNFKSVVTSALIALQPNRHVLPLGLLRRAWSALAHLAKRSPERLAGVETSERARQRTDEELMAAYVDGERGAFEELYRRFAPRVLALIRRQVRTDAEAKELLQQTFLQAHRARRDYQSGRAVSRWLVTIALNLRRDAIRKRVRRGDEPEQAWVQTGPESPDRYVERRDEVRRVREALLRLDDKTREIIELHWFQDIPFPEIARMLGISKSAAKVRAHRGYAKLRELVDSSQ